MYQGRRSEPAAGRISTSEKQKLSKPSRDSMSNAYAHTHTHTHTHVPIVLLLCTRNALEHTYLAQKQT
jgi:hypothetical protein